MSVEPKVSIIIPSYNHKKYILETLKSIQAQTYKNIETIVIDDGSTDGSGEFLKSVRDEYQFQLIVKNNEGLCATINKGLDLANGDYIVIIASDDFMPAERIAQQVISFEGHNFDAVAGGMTLIDEESKELRYVSPLKLGSISFSDMLDKSVIYAPTVMFKAATFKRFGQYNSEHVIEDYSMWLKILSKAGSIANFDKNWAYYRIDQVVTRKKIDWYYRGLAQVFSEYMADSAVSRAFLKRRIKYLIKVSIFDGFQGLNDVIATERKGLNGLHITMLYVIAIMPAFIRNILKKRINRI